MPDVEPVDTVNGSALIDRRRFLIRSAGVAAAASGFASFLAACGSSKSDSSGADSTAAGTTTTTVALPATPTGTLRVAIPGGPNFIDPAEAREITEFAMTFQVYDALGAWDSDYAKVVPALAESWEHNADATVWTFKLRSGVTFHDGSIFDSSVAKKTVEHYKASTGGAPLANLTSVDTPDPVTMVVNLSKPAPDFERNLVGMMMISPKLLDAGTADKEASGTGRYKLASWDKGNKMVLEAVPGHWSGKGPYLQTIELRSIPEQTTALSALDAGDIDLVMKVAPRQVQTLAKNSKFTLYTKESWTEGNLLFRTDQKPTDDVRVRQAVAWAIDRQAIVDKVLLGQAVVAMSPMPPGTYGVVVPPTAYGHDVAKAKQLLTDAGFPNGVDVKMDAFAAIRVLGEDVCQAIVAMLAEAGIRASLDIQEAGVAVKDALADQPEHQIFHLEYGWGNGGPLHFTLGTALSHAKYTGADLVDLQTTATTTPDGPERSKALADLQDGFMKQLPHLPLYHLKLTDVSSNKVHGYTNPKDGYSPRFGEVSVS